MLSDRLLVISARQARPRLDCVDVLVSERDRPGAVHGRLDTLPLRRRSGRRCD